MSLWPTTPEQLTARTAKKIWFPSPESPFPATPLVRCHVSFRGCRGDNILGNSQLQTINIQTYTCKCIFVQLRFYKKLLNQAWCIFRDMSGWFWTIRIKRCVGHFIPSNLPGCNNLPNVVQPTDSPATLGTPATRNFTENNTKPFDKETHTHDGSMGRTVYLPTFSWFSCCMVKSCR